MEGLDYERHVRRMWAAFEREGVDGMRPYVDDDVEWVPSLDCDPIRGLAALSSYWNKVNGSRAVVPHAWERHGNCVLVHGSMRTFRDGGFVDIQPSWVYFFREGRLVRAVGYASREDAVAAIREHRVAGDD